MALSSSSSAANHVFDTSIFDGFRVLFNFSVVYGHVMYFMPIILDTPEPPFVLNAEKEPMLSILSLASFFLTLYSVDVFFFISGYLFGRSFCLRQRNNDTTLPYTLLHGLKHMLNRFLRLLPIFAIAWATGAARGARPCISRSMLYELFYVVNCSPAYGKAAPTTYMCLLVAWSLSTDVQAHAFMASVLIFFKSHKRAAQFLCFAVIVQILCRASYLHQLGRPLIQGPTIVSAASSFEEASELASVLNLPVGNITFAEGLGDLNRQMLTHTKVYASPYMRTAPAFIGFLTWYAVQEHNAYIRLIERNVGHTLFGIFSATATLLLAFFVVPALRGKFVWLCILHESVHRVAFACVVSAFVVILGSPGVSSKFRAVRAVRFMCTNKIVNRIASLSYAIYLLHPYVLWVATVIPPKIKAQQFELWRFVPSGFQVYLASIIVAIPCHFFESRFHALRKRLTTWKVPTSEKSSIKED